ncbi:universal stress protein [Methyloversatilis sp. XJ19-49]|uniref:universal stress protein n=1 Tax=Methyloversatilis sp. XJ19-49 TaxID=2963429 RepID=UPI00211BDA18|nr:universal stress protein [Methyloversatilis sp. XJ19-49]MCQ9378924.1 universal stress protein [Methyloversatilis sp. XJ19-49]
MNMDNKVLACVDQSPWADHVADYAAWAAQRLDAPLEFLHVIDRHPERGSGKDHSGSIGVDAQEALLTELSEQDAVFARTAREQGRVFLNRLRERATGAGAGCIDTRQRYGELEETLVEQQHDVRLLVIGRRGESAATTQRDLGRNVERVVRALTRPILTVTDAFRAPKKVLVAYDGGGITRRGIDMLAASPLLRGLDVHVLMSGPERPGAPKDIEQACATLNAGGLNASGRIIPGDPEQVISHYASNEEMDLLVMGAWSHSPLRSLLFGSKTSDLLRSARLPVLLLR